jgi:hypothetical protein
MTDRMHKVLSHCSVKLENINFSQLKKWNILIINKLQYTT